MPLAEREVLNALSLSPARAVQLTTEPLVALEEEIAAHRKRIEGLQRRRRAIPQSDSGIPSQRLFQCLEKVFNELNECAEELEQRLTGVLPAAELAANAARRVRARDLAATLITTARREQLDSRVC